jgi:hypothetical protein
MGAKQHATQSVKIDRATIFSAGVVFTLMSMVFFISSILPARYDFFSKVASLLAPMICVPVFTWCREAFLAKSAAAGRQHRADASSVQFFTYAIVATLVLWFLLELFNAVSILQKIQLLSDLRADNVVLEQASLDRAKYGDGAVVLPGLFMAAFAVGWTIHSKGIARPVLCIITLVSLMTVLRASYLILSPILSGFVHDQLSVFALGLLTYPVLTGIGTTAGYASRALFTIVAQKSSRTRGRQH